MKETYSRFHRIISMCGVTWLLLWSTTGCASRFVRLDAASATNALRQRDASIPSEFESIVHDLIANATNPFVISVEWTSDWSTSLECIQREYSNSDILITVVSAHSSGGALQNLEIQKYHLTNERVSDVMQWMARSIGMFEADQLVLSYPGQSKWVLESRSAQWICVPATFDNRGADLLGRVRDISASDYWTHLKDGERFDVSLYFSFEKIIDHQLDVLDILLLSQSEKLP